MKPLNYASASFVTSAPDITKLPPDTGIEIAFAGRSNAGKSSALNTLTRQKSLARTSKTPGRTQLINYFQIGELPLALVDLPGYGFAKVPLAVKNEWQRELDNYLQNRDALIGLVLLMDIRHPLKEFDNAMIQWAKRSEMPLHILLTKADKLKRGPAQSALLQVRKAVSSLGKLVSVQTYSSLNGEGTDELQKRLNSWLLPPEDVAAETEETPEA